MKEKETSSDGAVVNAAGLAGDVLAERAGFDVDALGYRLHPCKGDYFALAPGAPLALSRLVYPVPAGPGLGVHATLDLGGRIRFGPDAEYVLSGSEDGTVWRWRTATGEALPPLQGHTGPVGALKVNPTRMLLASACSALCLWLPQPPPQQLQQHMQQQHPTGMMG